MNTILKVLAAALVLVACAQAQEDQCLTNSYAPVAVNSITGSGVSFSGLTTAQDVNTALNALYKIAVAMTTPFLQNIYVGASNDDFYMVKNCVTQEGPNDYCTSASQYIVYVCNKALYGDQHRHVFTVTGGAVDVSNAATALTPETNDYTPSTRFWYTAPGWSGLIDYASGGQGKTYSKAFGTGLVAGADRSLMEYCGACLQNSYAVTVTQTLAITDFSMAKGISAASGFSAVATAIKTVMDAVASDYAINGIIGFPNGDSYMVQYCKNYNTTQSCQGVKALFYVTNKAVYGDNTRRVFKLADNGAVGDSVGDVGAYNVTGRQWYATLNGWSETYPFQTTGNQGRTYVLAINGGVVGTDRISTEPCSRATAPCPTPSPSNCETSGAAALAASVLVVLAFAAIVF